MGGDWRMVRGLGLLILGVLAIGGLGIVAIMSWLELPQSDVSFLFLPWAALAAAGAAALWLITALGTWITTWMRRDD